MDAIRIIAVCQSGGVFESKGEDHLTYKGGDAHAIDIDEKMKFNEFKVEVAEMFSYGFNPISIKYFLPGNRKTLITISNDKDLQRMIKFHRDFTTVDVFITAEEVVAPELSIMPVSRSSRTTLSEAVIPVDDGPLEVVSDANQSHRDDPFVGLDIVDDTATGDDALINIPSDICTSIPLSCPSDEKHIKAAQQWQDGITGVGQRFKSVYDFREVLRTHAIAHQFAFKYKKNDSHRVTVKCKAEGCPWRIHASRLSTTQLICIKKMNPMHTCDGAVITSGYQATRSWVASIVKEKLKLFPNYKPKDIVNDINEEYGIQLNYFQAWRGKEIAKEQLQGSYKEAYSQLPNLCEKIMESNPGSLATFATKNDSSFHRLFVSFHASLYGFQQGCRPLLFLDSVALKSKYQGTLLAAMASDANDDVFPVAFAVVDEEAEDNCRWFLLQLKSALSTSSSITFVADRQKGLKKSISEVFNDSFHGYCLRYLSEELIKDLKVQFSHEVKRLLVEEFYNAAYAPKVEGFRRYMDSIKSISVEAYNWIIQSNPENWANSFFKGARYNHLTSNFGELFYSWACDAHDLPITQFVDTIRGKITDQMYSRRIVSDQMLNKLTPLMDERLKKEGSSVQSLHVLLLMGSTFEVRGDTVEVVDMEHSGCSCKRWQLTGLPCSHALAVIGWIGQNPLDYCSRYLTVESYKLTYSETINPIPNMGRTLLHASPSQAGVVTVTPPTRRPPGRPTKKKIGSHDVVKRQLQCSRCKGVGHNKSTCKQNTVEQ